MSEFICDINDAIDHLNKKIKIIINENLRHHFSKDKIQLFKPVLEKPSNDYIFEFFEHVVLTQPYNFIQHIE